MRETPYTILEEKQRLSRLCYVMLTIPPREERVLRMRLGINVDPMNQSEVARLMGRSRERVRQIEATAIRRLHRRLKIKVRSKPRRPVERTVSEPLPQTPRESYSWQSWHDYFLGKGDPREEREMLPPGYAVLYDFWRSFGR